MFKFVFIMFSLNTLAFDYTNKYESIVQDNKTQKIQKLKEMIGDDNLVFIPGILAQTVIEESDQPVKFSFLMGDYFKEYLDFCHEIKIKCTRVILESEASVYENSQNLIAQISQIKGPIWVVSHSKGSLEFLNVLISDEDIKNRTKGWLSMQAPFWGATSSAIYLENKILNKAANWVFNFLGGSIRGIESVSVGERKKYNNLNQDKIEKILKSVNHIHYGSYIKDEIGVETILEFSRDYILKNSGPNDGLVELSSTRYEHSNFVTESGYDHLVTILDLKKIKSFNFLFNEKNKNWIIERKKFLTNLLLLLKRG